MSEPQDVVERSRGSETEWDDGEMIVTCSDYIVVLFVVESDLDCSSYSMIS